MKVNANLVVGPRDVELTTPSHVKGVHEGNWPTHPRRRRTRRSFAEETAAVSRSTGINAEDREPIHSAMPKLTPP